MDTNPAIHPHSLNRTTPSAHLKNIMVVYQNPETRDWAIEACPQRNGRPQRTTWWNINDFSEPGVLAGAVSTAIRAEVIIVAINKGTGLPLPFYVWVNSWLPHRHLTEGKLVRLLGITPSGKNEPDSSQGYFRELARQGHFTLEQREKLLGAVPGTRPDRVQNLLSKRANRQAQLQAVSTSA